MAIYNYRIRNLLRGDCLVCRKKYIMYRISKVTELNFPVFLYFNLENNTIIDNQSFTCCTLNNTMVYRTIAWSASGIISFQSINLDTVISHIKEYECIT